MGAEGSISTDERKQITHAFRVFDLNDDGKISAQEFKDALLE